MFFRVYKTFSLLSIDVALGAMASALFFARIFTAKIPLYGYASLGLTVWIIYTADHLIDARSLSICASTERHRFHQQNFYVLSFFLVLAIILDILLLSYVRSSIIYSGLVLSAFVSVYLLVQSNLRSFKEIFGAILYAAGVLLPSIAVSDSSFSIFSFLLVLQFIIIALINLILFSWFDCEQDKQDNRSSLITIVGRRSGGALLTYLFIFQSLITISLLCLFSFSNMLLIPLLMTLVLLMIFLFNKFFSANDRYRYVGDAVFFLPLVCLLNQIG